jgi:hypothetical protein
MEVGIYTTKDLLQEWFVRSIPFARQTLSKFEHLNRMLDGFKNYELKQYRDMRNAIMFLCLPDIGSGHSDYIPKLAQLEKALVAFDVEKWLPGKYKAFKSRLASEKFIDSFSAQTELEVAIQMASRLGIENVALFPELSNGGNSDILVKLDSRPIYIEVGNLGASFPQRKIKQILDESAKHLGLQTDSNCYIQVIVDTAEFAFDASTGQLDVVSSVERINSEIDALCIGKLTGFEGFFNIDDLSYIVKNRELYTEFHHSPGDRLLGLINNEAITEWLTAFDPKILQKVRLVKGVIAGPIKNSLLVEIHTEGAYPSKAASAEMESFLRQITRNAKTQVDEQQIEPGTPNIILIRARNLLMSIFTPGELEPLRKIAQEFFDEIRNQNLTGLIIFNETIENALFIPNIHAQQPSRLSEQEIAKTGFRSIQNIPSCLE